MYLLPTALLGQVYQVCYRLLNQYSRRDSTHSLLLFFIFFSTSKGQSVTDSVLVRIVPSRWNKRQVLDKDGTLVRLQPGVIGAQANAFLGKSIRYRFFPL